ncbi:MAG: urease accessory protein UreD [Cellvibrionales bacterium]|nr:urease accessory protein UreD [Cellvibrionales bacterium]
MQEESSKSHQREPWKANLSLTLAPLHHKTRVIKSRHAGPLRIQRPFYPEEHCCHLYLLHPPGGLASKDELTLNVQLKSNAHALMTAPGATKFYRSSGDDAVVSQTFVVEDNAALEWLPHENIFFNGSQSKTQTAIYLKDSSQYIGWEMNSLARPANQEPFSEGNILSTLRIYRNKTLLLHESFCISSATNLQSKAGMQGFTMQGTLVVHLTKVLSADDARTMIENLSIPRPFVFGVTIVDKLLVVRVLSDFAETIRNIFIPLWVWLRKALLNKEAIEPRIWLT